MRKASHRKRAVIRRWTTPDCLHRVLVSHDEGRGRCLECGVVVATPFTILRAA